MRSVPLVSILIPVYNRETMIARALLSAMTQTHVDLEIIVVDNASTDRTFQIVQDHASQDTRVRCFRNERNVGPVRNWMKCLEHSSGEYIKFLFSDDWLDPQAVERLLAPLLEHPDSGFSYSSVEIHDETKGATILAYKQEGSRLMASFEFLRGQLTRAPTVPVSPGCALFRRQDVVRGLHPDIPNRLGLTCGLVGFGSDLLLFLRACDSYPMVYYLRPVLSHFRGHEDSLTISDRGALGGICYDVAFSWFLATSKLSSNHKRYFNTLLMIRSLNPSRLRAVNLHNPFQMYARMFPEQYNCFDLNLFPWGAGVPLFHKAVDLSRSLAKRFKKTR
jgi:glycosyltransferase involved in cell wall biosynthesis